MSINIAVAVWKGGSGKTTTSMLLAQGIIEELAKRDLGYDVRVLDADPQGSASDWYTLSSEENEESEFWDFEVQAANASFLRSELKRNKKRQKNGEDDFQINVIDTPPHPDISEDAIALADFVVVPIAPAEIEIDRFFTTKEKMRLDRKEYKMLIVRAREGTSSLNNVREELDSAEIPRFKAYIPLRERVQRSYGRPIAELNGYNFIAEELLDDLGLVAEEE